MSNTIALPMTVEELTAQWLTDAIGSTYPGVKVARAEVSDVIWGSATKVFVTAEYATAPAADGPPEKLCVKGGFDESVRAALQGVTDTGNQLEALFFADLAPRLDVELPRCWFAAGRDGQGVMVFDDLRAQNVVFGDPTRPLDPDRVAAGLELFAELHRQTWGRSFDEVPWLEVGSVAREAARVLFSAEHWEAHFARPDAPKLPESVADRERNLRGYKRLWAHDDQASHCLCHGDAHMGNTYTDESGRVLMLDWASTCLAPWSYDIAYFIAGALSVEDRRKHERALLAHYLDVLASDGGPQLDRDEAWTDYGRHHMHGLIWATVPPVMQSVENVLAMAERYAAALDDHDSLRTLGV
jgi:Phosphotransferase enzyme family